MKQSASAIEEAINFIRDQDSKSTRDERCRYYSQGKRCAIGGLMMLSLAAELEAIADGMCWSTLLERYGQGELDEDSAEVVARAISALQDYDPKILIVIQVAHDTTPDGPSFGERFEENLRARYADHLLYN